MSQQGFNSGVLLACAQNKVAPGDIIRIMEKQACLKDSAAINDVLLKLGSTILREGGYEDDAALMSAMIGFPMKSAHAKELFCDSVLETLGHASYQEAEEYQEKQASVILSGLAKGLGMTPTALQLSAMLAAAAGVAGGGAYWALNRDAGVTDDVTAAKEEQAKYYKRLAKDLQHRMKMKGLKDSTNKKVVNKPTSDVLPAAPREDESTPEATSLYA